MRDREIYLKSANEEHRKAHEEAKKIAEKMKQQIIEIKEKIKEEQKKLQEQLQVQKRLLFSANDLKRQIKLEPQKFNTTSIDKIKQDYKNVEKQIKDVVNRAKKEIEKIYKPQLYYAYLDGQQVLIIDDLKKHDLLKEIEKEADKLHIANYQKMYSSKESVEDYKRTLTFQLKEQERQRQR